MRESVLLLLFFPFCSEKDSLLLQRRSLQDFVQDYFEQFVDSMRSSEGEREEQE
jgi:hypothetical protein